MTKEEYEKALYDAATEAADETDFVSDLMDIDYCYDEIIDAANDWYNDDIITELYNGYDRYSEEDYAEWSVDEFINDELVPNMKEYLLDDKLLHISKYVERIYLAGHSDSGKEE